jgi:LAS superfamily LD-carboxypeptidase LdcB
MTKRRIVFRADRYIKGLRPVSQVPLKHRATYVRTILAAARAAKSCGEVWTCNSSYRTYSEQLALYNDYLAGRGNLAAIPGTSRHEQGNALDLSDPNGNPIGTSNRRKQSLQARGFVFAVPSERWHVEHRP